VVNPGEVIDRYAAYPARVAPVFLLTAVGRSSACSPFASAAWATAARTLEDGCGQLQPAGQKAARRNSMSSAAACACLRLDRASHGFALFVGLLIAVAFVDAFIDIDLSKFIGLLFMRRMLAFILALLVFLAEIFLAVSSARGQMR